jgi:hypothetical protein
MECQQTKGTKPEATFHHIAIRAVGRSRARYLASCGHSVSHEIADNIRYHFRCDYALLHRLFAILGEEARKWLLAKNEQWNFTELVFLVVLRFEGRTD